MMSWKMVEYILMGLASIVLGYCLFIASVRIYEVYRAKKYADELMDVMSGRKDLEDCKYLGKERDIDDGYGED